MSNQKKQNKTRSLDSKTGKRFERSFGKKEYRQLPRIYDRNASNNPQGYEEVEPERFHGCKNWTWWQDTETHVRHKRACNRCRDCRNYRHERIVGQAIAQATVSSVVMSLTLTYSDVDGETPDSALRLDYSDIERFLKRLRKAGYRFTKIACGEYGSKARAHWHLVLMFEWDTLTHSNVIEAIKSNHDVSRIGRDTDWRQLAPPIVANLRGEAFKQAISDPDLLVVTYPQSRRKTRLKTAHVRNTNWRFWKHGVVEAQIAKSPEYSNSEDIEGAIRYPMKYLSKDAWRDSRKYKTTPFEDLPEHIRQQTRFGPWKTAEEIDREWRSDAEQGKHVTLYNGHSLKGQEHRKWRYGNPYVKELEQQLLKQYACETDIPVEERLFRGVYSYKAKGGLGSAYFEALGAQTARLNWRSENMRGYQIGANYARKQRSLGMREIDDSGGNRAFVDSSGKLVVTGKRRFSYVMTNTNYRRFWAGFNAEKKRMGEPLTLGPKDAVIELQTQAAKASDSSTGSFGYHWWRKASVSARASMEASTGWMPAANLKGIFPTRWVKHMEENSKNFGWQTKALVSRIAAIKRDIKKNGAPEPGELYALQARTNTLAASVYGEGILHESKSVIRQIKETTIPVIDAARELIDNEVSYYQKPAVISIQPDVDEDYLEWVPPTNSRKTIASFMSTAPPDRPRRKRHVIALVDAEEPSTSA